MSLRHAACSITVTGHIWMWYYRQGTLSKLQSMAQVSQAQHGLCTLHGVFDVTSIVLHATVFAAVLAGVYFVPAFGGLLAPHWRGDARGIIVGLTSYTNKAHIVRALLEAICWQVQAQDTQALHGNALSMFPSRIRGRKLMCQHAVQFLDPSCRSCYVCSTE